MRKKLLSLARSVPGAVIAVAIVLSAVSISTARPSPAGAEGSVALSGFAWSENIGWISFSAGNDHDDKVSGTQPSPSSYGVRVDSTGALSGYAWSDNIGWIKFGGLSSFPNATLGGNAILEDGLRLKGWARACAGTKSGNCSSMASRTDGWDGWISLAGPGGSGRYGVELSNRKFGGFAWGSDVVGWINWDGVFTEDTVGECVGPNGEFIGNGQSRTYYGPVGVDGTCPQVTRTCTDGTLSAGAYSSLTCGAPAEQCERGGLILEEGESHLFYSERLVSGTSSACAGLTDLTACCEGLGKMLTCTDGTLVDAAGAEAPDHEFLRCTPAPRPIEF